nr:hypothetical protein [Tanacetum cinerariifolium]
TIIGEVDINTLTMKQYLPLTRGNQEMRMVKPKIKGNVNFEIKSQFMPELREDTFSRKKINDAHELVEWVLDIISTIYHSKTRSGLKKSVISSREVMKHCNKLGKDSQRPILGMTPAQALTSIQTITDHSQKWHNGSSSKNVSSSINSERITAIVSKLNSLGRDMKKLKENMHPIQVGCQTCGGAHLDKECPLIEEVKGVEEVKYREFSRPFPNKSRNNSRFNGGIFRYRSQTNDQPSSGERKLSFSDDEKHETEKEKVSAAIATLDIAPNVKLESQEEN